MSMQLPNPQKPKRSHKGLIVFIVLLCLIGAYVGAMLLMPAPTPTMALTITSGDLDTGEELGVDWPTTGSAAIGAAGSGVLVTNNVGTATPTASIAKVILAIAILREKPLDVGETGPTITITQEDEDLYNTELAQNGSVVPVQIGNDLTEYEALQALLLPSGNNIAITLANWAFGSQEEYIDYATNMLSEMGLTQTKLTDASGYSSGTVSTPSELILIGQEALTYPVLAEIVNQESATLPVAGTVYNVNSDLGQSDINGIKTGNTDEAGGCFLFSATRTISGKKVTLIGAVQKLDTLSDALSVAPDLIDEGFQNFVYVQGAPTNASVGTVTTAWGESSEVYAKSDISQVVWNGTAISRTVTSSPALGGVVGKVLVGNNSTDLILKTDLSKPTAIWRLTHPIQMISG